MIIDVNFHLTSMRGDAANEAGVTACGIGTHGGLWESVM